MTRSAPRAEASTTESSHTSLRGALVGLVCGVGALVAHTAASSSGTDLTTAVLLVTVGLGAGPLLLRRRPSFAWLATATVALQVGGHVAMALTVQAPVGHGAHSMGSAGAHGALDPGAGSPMSAAAAMVAEGGAPMMLGHLLAALLTAALALEVDRALVALLRGWWEAALVLSAAPVVVPGREVAWVRSEHHPLMVLAAKRLESPRGPPWSGRFSVLPA